MYFFFIIWPDKQMKTRESEGKIASLSLSGAVIVSVAFLMGIGQV